MSLFSVEVKKSREDQSQLCVGGNIKILEKFWKNYGKIMGKLWEIVVGFCITPLPEFVCKVLSSAEENEDILLKFMSSCCYHEK